MENSQLYATRERTNWDASFSGKPAKNQLTQHIERISLGDLV